MRILRRWLLVICFYPCWLFCQDLDTKEDHTDNIYKWTYHIKLKRSPTADRFSVVFQIPEPVVSSVNFTDVKSKLLPIDSQQSEDSSQYRWTLKYEGDKPESPTDYEVWVNVRASDKSFKPVG